jgi:hypothetical protein
VLASDGPVSDGGDNDVDRLADSRSEDPSGAAAKRRHDDAPLHESVKRARTIRWLDTLE